MRDCCRDFWELLYVLSALVTGPLIVWLVVR